ncbi:MAG: TetR/AcrR family transcriptional regulator [Pseudomonadota bacterium]
MTKTPAPQTKGEKTKERIRQGVRNLLATRDFSDISIEDVVKETNVHVGSIYFHFKNKDGLMHSIAEEEIQAFFAYFKDIETENLFSAAFLYCWRSVQSQIYRYGNLRLTMWHLNQDPSNIEKSLAPYRQDLIERFAMLIAKASKRRDRRNQDLMLAELLVLGTENFLLKTPLQQKRRSPAQYQKVAFELAQTWYRAALGVAPHSGAAKADAKRIVAETKLLKRPAPLPPVN